MTQPLTQQIYGLVASNGDGSATIQWFRNKEIATYLVGYDYDDQETFIMNERYINKTLNFPADLDLEKCGFKFSDKRYAPVVDGTGPVDYRY